MINRDDVIRMAHACGFGDIGFTTADPFESQKQILQERQEEYAWAMKAGLNLMAGTDPKSILPEARSIVVLMEAYFREGFPPSMENHFGRCYLDDDRVTQDRLSKRIKAFREFLRERGIRQGRAGDCRQELPVLFPQAHGPGILGAAGCRRGRSRISPG